MGKIIDFSCYFPKLSITSPREHNGTVLNVVNMRQLSSVHMMTDWETINDEWGQIICRFVIVVIALVQRDDKLTTLESLSVGVITWQF